MLHLHWYLDMGTKFCVSVTHIVCDGAFKALKCRSTP